MRRAGLDRRHLDVRGIREDQALDDGRYLPRSRIPRPTQTSHSVYEPGASSGAGTSTVISRATSTTSMRAIAARCAALTSSADTSAVGTAHCASMLASRAASRSSGGSALRALRAALASRFRSFSSRRWAFSAFLAAALRGVVFE
ncbi:hypothetical protein [Streptomyces sp. NPDC001275]